MSEFDDLPEYYLTDDRPPQRIAKATYEALAQCQIIMQSAETGVTGPTMVEPGEVFVTDGVPNHQWLPLNRAAGERYQNWLSSLPQSGNGLTQAEITEAAYIMRPREGEAELPHEQWWPAVLKMAASLKDKRQGNSLRIPQPAQQVRAGAPKPVMPFMTAGPSVPAEPGRAPVQADHARQLQSQGDGARRARPARPAAPLSNASPSESQVQTAT